MDAKERELLQLIEKNGRLETATVARLMGISEEETIQMIEKLEHEKVILGYSAIINWTKGTDEGAVTAMIDVKVTPKRGVGFDKVAERIYRFPEVKAVYLMSGVYDLSVSIEGKSMAEVGRFVSEKLSTIDSVISTTTHFILKKYKHDGLVFSEDEEDKRIVVSP
ncbi:Lrp/AsnC family transcriptional regulator [Fictibacillus terranigra]|uniref:Lrp/AsnC family transcriptional regulator n=1 Tax=Fictibacillus terranigra TaxID=3058424 RepID=A0ABT8E804_9BACL|nr:Lrp/AsnC family transcriptional regulator [Fictibacillus sp. CENA-BCM004]MDN4074013.1 Lrp/AsnC family transcriptional regulator [Fictibacillus sp. CENA-BCM004]